MNNLEKNNLKIGDKVNFVVERSLLTGIITKFYKNEYNHEECSVKTEHKTYPHILLHRVSKVKELNKEEFVSQIRKQVCDEIRSLAKDYFEFIICDKCGNTTDNDCHISSKAFYGILKQVEKGEKENERNKI